MCQSHSTFPPRRARQECELLLFAAANTEPEVGSHLSLSPILFFFLVASLWPEYYESLPPMARSLSEISFLFHGSSHVPACIYPFVGWESTPFPGESLINTSLKKACDDADSWPSSAFLPTFWGKNDWNLIFCQTLLVSARLWRFLRQAGRWFQL